MEVRKGGSKDDIRQGYNIWVDLTDPTTPELLNVQQSFHLDGKALEEYTNILSSIVDKYEQLLTAIGLSVTDIEQRSFYRPSRKMLEYLDNLSRQIIILRRHFWHIRDIINFLTHMQEDKPDIKYLKIVYDDINQLIDLVESYQETVNSTRELYIANVSLQMNDDQDADALLCDTTATNIHFKRLRHEWARSQ